MEKVIQLSSFRQVKNANSVEKLINDFEFELKAFQKSKGTIKEYPSAVRLMLSEMNIKSSGDIVRLESFETYTKYIASCTQNGVSNSTMNTRRAILISFVDFLFRNDYVTRNVIKSTQRLSVPKKEVTTLNDEQVVEFVQHMYYKTKGTGNDTLNAYREYVMTAIMINCGIRVGECVDIRLSDIDFEKQSLKIRGKGYAGQVSRELGLSDQLISLITKWLNMRSEIEVENESKDYLFVSTRTKKHIKIGSLEKRYAMVSEELGYKVHPHLLRHTFATNMIHNNKLEIQEVSDILGHSDITITSKYYVATNNESNMKLSNISTVEVMV